MCLLSISTADGILPAMAELIFVRHGQTHGNVAGRWEGWSDDALTPLGRAQAEAVAQRLANENEDEDEDEFDEVAALYTSPLRRALQTARIIGAALGLQPVSEDGFREINFGELNGITLEEMEAHHPALFARWKNRTDTEFQWPGGERRAGFFHRVGECLRPHPCSPS